MGLAMLHNIIFSVSFTRPVLKYILGRSVSWHDLAFFDIDLYENLRKLLASAQSLSDDEFAAIGLTFEVCQEIGYELR